MNIMLPSVVLENPVSYVELLSLIERAGRVCYKSEDRITENSSAIFIKNIIKRGHEAVLEHGIITVRVICDRGVSHEIVRHRIGAYCQESTRYCNYSKEKFGKTITFILPADYEKSENCFKFDVWEKAMKAAEMAYFEMLEKGATPQEARSVLPNSTKTEMYITYNIREWRHFLKLRTSAAAHPDMQKIANKILALFKKEYPLFFEDIGE